MVIEKSKLSCLIFDFDFLQEIGVANTGVTYDLGPPSPTKNHWKFWVTCYRIHVLLRCAHHIKFSQQHDFRSNEIPAKNKVQMN